MSEKLIIVVQADGTRTVKRELEGLGKAGEKSARQIRRELQKALKDQAYNVRVAMNSTRLAEAARVQAARAASAEIKRIKSSELQAIKAALKAETSAVRAAKREQVNIARAQRRAAIDQRIKQRDAKRDATFGLGNFGSVLGLVGLKEAISGFITLSDSMMNVRNRLAIVTDDSSQLDDVIRRLRASALDSRSEFDLTTRTYARLAQSTKALSLSQSVNISMTQTLTKAIAVSGATGAEAHATLIQLSQAMGSNRLSADEFRSVAEQLPIILDLLADSTKKPRAALKKMGEEGLLTARVIALAILEGHDKIESMFAKTAPTIEQTWENIRTQARFAVDAFNKSTGAGEGLVKVLQSIANNMDTVTVVVKLLATMIGGYLVTQMGLATKAMYTLALANPWTAAAVGLGALISLVIQFRKEIGETTSDWGYFAGIMVTPPELMTEDQKNAIRTGRTPAGASRDAKSHSAALAESNRSISDIAMEKLERQVAINRLKAMPDVIDAKKKRHVPTFNEALAELRRENLLLSNNIEIRERLGVVMSIQDKIERKLIPNERKIIENLYEHNKALRDHETVLKAIKDLNFERSMTHVGRGQERSMNTAVMELQKDIGRDLTPDESSGVREAARLLYRDQENSKQLDQYFDDLPKQLADKEKREEEELALRYRMRAGNFSGISSQEDFAQARGVLAQDRISGDSSEAEFEMKLKSLELIDDATPKMRKLFLEETTGIGQFAADLDGIFGPSGMLTKGFADATANALVFHESFKTSINALGKQIQAEIISTLIQGLIRMSILGALGGGTASAGTQGALQLANLGTGRAAGGYAEGGRTRVAGYHHGGEYVVNAQATQQNRPLLESINKGGKANNAPGRGSRASGLAVTFIDQAGVSIETKQLSEREVQIIARREVNKEAPRVIAGHMSDHNSRVNKAMRGNSNVRPQR